MRIRLHCRELNGITWRTNVVESDQIPRVGEFLAPAPVRVFRVVMTLHVLFEADFQAEVFAEQIDFGQAQLEALGEVVWKG